MRQQPSWAKHLDFMFIDLLSLVGAFVAAYWLKFGDFSFIDSASWKALLLMMLLTDFVVTLLMSTYSGVLRRGYWADVGEALKSVLASFLVVCVVFYLMKVGEDYSREMLLTTYGVYLLLSMLLKGAYKKIRLSRKRRMPADSVCRIIVVTNSYDARPAEKLVVADDIHSSEVVGFCFVDSENGGKLHGKPTVSVDGLVELASCLRVDEVLVMVDPALVGSELFERLIEDGVRVSFSIEEAIGVKSETQVLGNVGALKTLRLERYSFGAGQLLYLPIKRLIDVVLGFAGCVLLVPLVCIVKVSYLASGDGYPVVYRQDRVGRRGRMFKMYKLRTMVWNADELLEELLNDPEMRAEWERGQKLGHDPRVTRVGRVLRRTSLDEFPQFLNVMRGEMSIVGPRPLVPGELEEHGGRSLYNKVRPGITGWWGCNGRSNIEYRERLELEYHYVRNCSLYLDVVCLLRTFVALAKRDGAR